MLTRRRQPNRATPRKKIFPSLSIVTSPSLILYRITTNLAVVPYFHLSLGNLRVPCVSVVNNCSKNSLQRHREYGGCTENFN
jgi:hypothetical protein